MAVDDHGDGGVVVFQAGEVFLPELPSSHVAALQAYGKVHVYPGDFRRKDSCAGTAFYVNEFLSKQV